jgi:hypothetical protein
VEPEAPEGAWYKDFGSFKIGGEGEYPKTFLPPRPAGLRPEAVALVEAEPNEGSMARKKRKRFESGRQWSVPL